MNIKAKNLIKILETCYLENDNVTFIESKNLMGKKEESQLTEVFHNLGGILDFPDIRINGYLFENRKFVLEFDDQLSFNRYRLKTFRSEIYQHFHGIKLDKYRGYCKKFEGECLKSGIAMGIWTNTKAEQFFGKSENPGDLGLNGSSGWKMRAFEEFLKDVYSKYARLKLLRVSIWDELMIDGNLKKLGELLNNPDKKTSEFILKFIERRVINLFAD